MAANTRPTPAPSLPGATGAKKPIGVWIAVGSIVFVAIAAIIAIAASRGGDSTGTVGAGDPAWWGQSASQLKQVQPVTVAGENLPKYDSTKYQGTATADPAVGKKAPALTGKSFDGTPVKTPTETKQLVLFIAHWCQHCHKEVPLLASWIAAGKAPADLKITTVSTGYQKAYDPAPSTWLTNEHWREPVLVDDDTQAAAQAYGLGGYPYFVLINSDGTIAKRNDGEIAIADFEKLLTTLK